MSVGGNQARQEQNRTGQSRETARTPARGEEKKNGSFKMLSNRQSCRCCSCFSLKSDSLPWNSSWQPGVFPFSAATKIEQHIRLTDVTCTSAW
ncbi:hypothetical protein SRHO_G00161980 [Serrasalmus rhombeus]